MPTLRSYRHEVARKLGGFKVGTVTLDPDPSDILAQRQVLSALLYDADKGSKGYSDQFCWVGRHRDQRRFRASGYRSLAYSVFVPPVSGTYTLTLYGYGTTAPIAFNADGPTIQAAITTIAGGGGGLDTVTVSGDGNPYVLSLPDIIDTEISSGTMLATGGIGALEVQRSFTHALVTGDEYEIHSKLPVDDDDNIQGLNTIINMALRRMWFIDKFPITPVLNSRGYKTFYGLSGEQWLTQKRQIISLYGPVLWELVSTFTPPVSGSYSLTLTVAGSTAITSSLPYDADAETIRAALAAASGLPITVAGTGPYTITLPETYYAVPALAASAGTVANVRTRLDEPTRYPSSWSFEYDGEEPYIRNYVGQVGQSFYVEAYRPAHSWVCPQASYGVLGDTWTSSEEGLTGDYDQAVPSVEAVAAVAYAIACRQLCTVGPGHESGHWEREAQRAERASAATKLYDLPFNDKPSGGGYGVVNADKGFWSSY